jgi:hypothetical protein
MRSPHGSHRCFGGLEVSVDESDTNDDVTNDDLSVGILTGTVQYQGWRLDLLSYQIPSG